MKLLTLLCLILYVSEAFSANAFLDSLNRRYEVKKQERWTLGDWLATKEKVRLMDMWLAANTSNSLFEFYLEGSQVDYETQVAGVTTSENDYNNYGFAAYVSLFGLKYERAEDQDTNLVSERFRLVLRLLGAAEQATNISLHLGQREFKNTLTEDVATNLFYGASLRMYLIGSFGIYGELLKFLKGDVSSGDELEGRASEYGVFLDLFFLQLYGNVYEQVFDYRSSGASKDVGQKLGLRIYF